ncbi:MULTISPECIES: CBS domain-containing protein [Methanosarcina]|uniref:Papain family cysteine protease n=1 Tax=Methanosarcina vacuolata Z-761 TaxID=1434123 RepID=A0A0E3Q1J9_9EURY|nr:MULTISPECIES: CBS domain-containing protein [Methanosarcina]AKB42319.1 Papain family cysteine protease [Methanosarcina vacuolata Z-761]AKB45823.1 putative manganese-dependent inorganic pyrophosphatase [Methanosarcina sp. Kolksee]
MNVSEIMSEGPISIKEGDFVTHARQLMRDYLLRSLVVVDEENRLVGMLSDQDILRVTSTRSNVTVDGYASQSPTVTPDMDVMKAARLIVQSKQNRVPVVKSTADHTVVGVLSNVDILRNVELPKNLPKTIQEIMTKKVEICSPEERVAKIWGRMLETDYTGIPVASKTGEPIGMITRRDIIKSGAVRISVEDDRATRPNDSPKVETVMSTPTYTISESDSVRSAIEMIIHYDIGRVTVVNEHGKVSGIADRQDLLKSIVNVWTEQPSDNRF